jgi:hypothetical protein
MRPLLIVLAALTMPMAALAQPDRSSSGAVMVHPIRGDSAGAPNAGTQQFEPPDPCRRYHATRAHARCLARLHQHSRPRVDSTRLGQDPRR